MKLRRITFILIFIIACTDENEDLLQREYPVVETLPISDISAQGATFEAKVSNLTGTLSDRGFVWNYNDPSRFSSEIKSLGPGDNSFSYQVTSTLASQINYGVRAYAVVNGLTIYGNLVQFTSLGSSGPVISDFNPKIARSLDTLTITGSGFSRMEEANIVAFDAVAADIVYNSENLLKVIVPDELNKSKSLFDLSVTTTGNKTVAPTPFQLDPASPFQLVSVDKNPIKQCDTLTLTSDYLPANSYDIKVYFNGYVATPYLKNGNILKVKVPYQLPVNTTDVTIELVIGNQQSTLPYTLTFNPPEIDSFSPASFGPSSTLTVYGQNLPLCGLTGKINNQPVTLKNISTTQFQFDVPGTATIPFTLDVFTYDQFQMSYTFE